MPGYQLLEQSVLVPYKRGGVEPYPQEIGLLDFLRELAADDLPFPRFHTLRVVGLEEVLFAVVPVEEALALEIHRLLRRAASDLERRLMNVQIVFTGRLMRGESLWSEYRGRRLPIGHIFGSPTRQTDARGNSFYTTNFNLTHA